jgi:hypothetical protein
MEEGSGLFGKNKNNNTFYIEYRPWEYVVEMKGGGYSNVKADKETRDRQLAEYKKKRVAELERQIQEVKNIF